MITKIETLRASSAQLAGSEIGTVSNGGEIKLQQAWHMYSFVLDVTAVAADVDDTFNVYIDTSYDGGTTWVNVVHFTQMIGTGSAEKHVANVHESINSLIEVTMDAASGVVRNLNMGDRVRYRATVVDPTGADATFTYSLIAFLANGRH